MDVLYIVIPAYNEEENIEALIHDWYPVIEKHDAGGKSRLVVVNDGSRDGTLEILRACAADHPRLTVLDKPNGGHGPAVLYGYRYAIKRKADYIFQTDADGQTNPAEFEGFWRIRGRYDAVIGYRPDRQDGAARVFVEKVLVFLLRMIFGVRVPDANAPFRLMRTEAVERYLPLMPKTYNLPNVILTTCFAYFGDALRFEPISFRPRQGGTNSINLEKITKIGWQALHDFRVIHRRMKSERKGGTLWNLP